MTVIISGDGITSDNIASLAASKLTGQVADANAPSGSIVQIVSNTYQVAGGITTNSTSFITTGLSASITPSSSANKIYVKATFPVSVVSGTTNLVTFYRNGSNVVGQHLMQHSSAGDYVTCTMQYLDSPASTSAQTYTVYFRSASSTYSCKFGGDNYSAYPVMVVTLMEVAS